MTYAESKKEIFKNLRSAINEMKKTVNCAMYVNGLSRNLYALDINGQRTLMSDIDAEIIASILFLDITGEELLEHYNATHIETLEGYGGEE